MNNTDWPFEDPPNVATFTLRKILRRETPILAVFRDEEDGAWQFLDGSDSLDTADAAVVSLAAILKLDPSIEELHDLPCGWCAWRPHRDAAWRRKPHPASNDSEETT